jgi:hypothetical protein
MCRANGELLTKKDQVLSRWKEHFEQHLYEVDLRDDGAEIDLPGREEIESALKYLKNNKAAGGDSIAFELLKNGGPQLVDAPEEMSQHTTVCYPTPTRSFSITKLGSSPGESTTDLLFALRQILEKANE